LNYITNDPNAAGGKNILVLEEVVIAGILVWTADFEIYWNTPYTALLLLILCDHFAIFTDFSFITVNE
jgi:hypothetical protein